MSLIYRRKGNQPNFSSTFYDYIGEMRPFVKRVRKPHLVNIQALCFAARTKILARHAAVYTLHSEMSRTSNPEFCIILADALPKSFVGSFGNIEVHPLGRARRIAIEDFYFKDGRKL